MKALAAPPEKQTAPQVRGGLDHQAMGLVQPPNFTPALTWRAFVMPDPPP